MWKVHRWLAASILLALLVSPATASGRLRVGLHADESTLTPYSYVTGDPGYNLLLFVYDTLFQINADGVPEPWLVEAWAWSEDGRQLTLDLRADVIWHDGEPFTAADVVFTFDYVRRYAHTRWTGPAQAIERIEEAGRHRVVITLRDPSAGFIYQPLADQPIMPKHLWKDVTDPRTFDGRIGTGPFRLVEYVPDQYYRFEANRQYFRGPPAAEELVMPIIKDSTALFTALKAGEVDAVSRTLTPELVGEFSALPRMRVVSGPLTVTYLLCLNNQVTPFDDRDFRRAVALAVDRRDMVDTLFLGHARLGSPGWVHPDLPWYHEELDREPAFDPDLARQLLDRLGYLDVDNDGLREWPDGRGMTLALLASSHDPIRLRGAELVAAYLKAVGLRVNVVVMERASLSARIGWGEPDHDYSKPRNYEMVMWGWSAPVQSWPGRMLGVFHSDHRNVGTLNLQGSSDPLLDTVLEQIVTTADLERQFELARQAQRRIADTIPFVTLLYPDGVYAFNAEAYDGWVFVKGQGIFNKLSFLGGSPPAPAAGPSSGTGGRVAVIALLLLAVVAVGVAWRRRLAVSAR